MTRRRALTLAVIVLATGIGYVVLGADEGDPLAAAERIAADAGAFETGLESAESLARIAQHLNDAIDDCRREAPEGAVTCRSLGSASGYAQVLAAAVLDCTAPGRFEARDRMAAYLATVGSLGHDATRVPDPPDVVECTR